MSHMVTRKGPVGEDKDKRQTDSPVKEMKKKLAANAEKEKLAAEKNVEKATDKQAEKATDKAADKKEKPVEKQVEKADKKDKSFEKKEKSVEKKEKSVEKAAEKKEKSVEKSVEKKDKSTDKTVEKPAEKKSVDKNVDKPAEKSTEKKDKVDKKEPAEKPKVGTSAEKNEKKESEEEKARKAATARQNGDAANGNGTASGSEDEELIIVEQDGDEMFPELAYDDNSDADGSEPEPAGRSVTRRSQVKVTRTPETPRPASDKQADKNVEADDSKEPMMLKLKEDLSDRRLRSASSPKPVEKKAQEKESKESPKKEELVKKISPVLESKPLEQMTAADKQEPAKSDRVEMEVENIEEVAEMAEAASGELTRRDTRYSRSRVKVSPYRRSARPADDTASSTLANYTGNNTTMEMDITESSIFSEEPSNLEESYVSDLRRIHGRRSYKQLKPLTLRKRNLNTSQVPAAGVSARESGARPTGTVVGRKRRPDAEMDAIEVASEVGGNELHESHEVPKRARLLDRLARPFRTHSTPLPARRAAEIVGINTDLPLTAPVAAATDTFDPETIKPTPTITSTPSQKPAPTLVLTPTATPTSTRTPIADRDSKRCIVM